MEIILQFPFRKNVKQINILQKISLTLHFYEVALHIRILTGALIFTVRLRFPPCSWDRNCFGFFLSLSPPLVIPDGEHFQLSTSRQEMGLYGTRHVPNCWFIRRTKYEPGKVLIFFFFSGVPFLWPIIIAEAVTWYRALPRLTNALSRLQVLNGIYAVARKVSLLYCS